MTLQELQTHLSKHYAQHIVSLSVRDMIEIEVAASDIKAVCQSLRDDPALNFSQLMDLCGVDYLDYGVTQWRQEFDTAHNYNRAVNTSNKLSKSTWSKSRYAVVYHLLSMHLNQRLRLKVYLEPEPVVDSVIDIWPAVNWYEREAYDLFGIVFEGHPDLRRLLTDYGFKGHPFRKDFPLIGEVEMRYDAKREACVYEPVSIQPRITVPKVIRKDARYYQPSDPEGDQHE
jgi:NADH-quinone oxidoreductase subunit C